jgi:hypothetical protein
MNKPKNLRRNLKQLKLKRNSHKIRNKNGNNKVKHSEMHYREDEVKRFKILFK